MHQELPVVDIMPNEEYIKVSFQEIQFLFLFREYLVRQRSKVHIF